MLDVGCGTRRDYRGYREGFNLGDLWRERGAASLYRRALAIAELVYGPAAL